MIKLLIIIFIILVLIIVYLKLKQNNVEGYTNANNKVFSNNYIINGSFQEGEKIENSTLIGNSKIISFLNNPGNSTYVCAFYKDGSTGMTINISDLEINDIYKFSFYYNADKLPYSFNNNLKFSIVNNNYQTQYLSQKLSVSKEPLIINNIKWYQVQSTITIPKNCNSSKPLVIQLLKTSNINTEFVYTTEFKFYKILKTEGNYELTKSLKTLLLKKSYTTNSNLWKDFSGFNNNFYFNPNKPVATNKYGISIYQNNLIGPMCSDVFGYKSTDFTILFSFELTNPTQIKNIENISTMMEEEEEEQDNSQEEMNENLFLTIPGNQDYLLKVYIHPESGYVSIYAVDGKISMFRSNLVLNKALMSITYTNNTLYLYQNGTLIASTSMNKAILYPSSSEKIIMNKNKNINVFMNYFAIYNSALGSIDYETLEAYFNGYYNPSNYNTIIINGKEVSPDDEMDLWEKCENSCQKLCENVNYNTNLYNKCKQNCIYTDSCVDYCAKNPNSYFCKNYNDCPTVYVKNGNFIVYIPKSYSSIMRVGPMNYGNLRTRARKLFKLNFPNCPVPDILLYPDGVHPISKCPYLINNGVNPCGSNECNEVDWSKSPYKQNIDKKCKQKISNYCRLYKDLDPDNCKCWTDKFKDTKICREHRKYFEDPNDYNCCINDFKIQEHPDFYKYIDKQKIPCYACDIKYPPK